MKGGLLKLQPDSYPSSQRYRFLSGFSPDLNGEAVDTGPSCRT